MGLREAQGACERHHLPVRGAYGLLEAALACERLPLTSRGLIVQGALRTCERHFWWMRVYVGLHNSQLSEI